MYQKRGLLKGRKAQITVFMIVGIILLFSSALLFYIRGQIVSGIPQEFIPTLEEVPLEAQPIKIFVEDCMKKVASEGIVKLGAHGGYIDPADPAYGAVFTTGFSPTDSDALAITDSKSGVIPYWWFMSSPNNCLQGCQLDSMRPGLYKTESGVSIEGQIDEYVKRNLPGCLEGFMQFKEQGFNVEILGEMSPDFKVAERESLILLSYPLRVTREGKVIDVENFFTKIDVNLKNVYDLATDIINSEVAFHFLESHALNLIAMYSKPIGVNRLPPTAYFSFDQGEYLIWTTSETKDRLESYVLPPGISMLQIVGTSNYRRHAIFDTETNKYDRVGTGLMDKSLVILNSSKQYPALETRMAYLDWWPIYLNINDAEVLKPTEVGPSVIAPLTELIGMKQYKFMYDLSFPVLVTIGAPDAFEGRGLKFVFSMEANLRNNMAMNTSFFRLPRALPMSYFCDINQRNSGLQNIDVQEMYTGEPVPHARVDFIAGDELCFVGFAELDERNKSVLSAKFPVGVGEIRILKDGYVPVKKSFGAFLRQEGNYSFKMMPFMKINASVAAVPLSYQSGRYVLPPGIPTASLSPKERAIMTFKRLDDDEFGEYDAFLTYNLSKGMSELMIVPGTYEVEGYIILNDRIVIPKEEKPIEVPFSDDQIISMNQSIFEQWSSGGVKFNNVTGYLKITREDILNSDFVRFKLLRFPLPITHSSEINAGPDLEQSGKYEEYSNLYSYELQPDWVR